MKCLTAADSKVRVSINQAQQVRVSREDIVELAHLNGQLHPEN